MIINAYALKITPIRNILRRCILHSTYLDLTKSRSGLHYYLLNVENLSI